MNKTPLAKTPIGKSSLSKTPVVSANVSSANVINSVAEDTLRKQLQVDTNLLKDQHTISAGKLLDAYITRVDSEESNYVDECANLISDMDDEKRAFLQREVDSIHKENVKSNSDEFKLGTKHLKSKLSRNLISLTIKFDEELNGLIPSLINFGQVFFLLFFYNIIQ